MNSIYESRKIANLIQKSISFDVLYKKKINFTEYWVTFKTNTRKQQVLFFHDPNFKAVIQKKIPEFDIKNVTDQE